MVVDAASADTPSPSPSAGIDRQYANIYGEDTVPQQEPTRASSGVEPISSTRSKFVYKVVLACRPARISDTAGGEETNCSYAMTACSFRNPPSDDVLYWVQSRPRSNPDAAWTTVNTLCGLDALPPGVPAPPAIPTMGQIQTAFRQLPFSKPRVAIQPAGNVTLVNLPTYFRATWPGDAGLQPGEVSAPVKLLSWSVEFKIAPRSYEFHYGDGSSSGQVTDAGGVYPDGKIRHTYTSTDRAAKVTVDSQLTGQYRVNGGPWTPINAVADLQNEPVTTLQVREAEARLVDH
ncbi:hypothetical protein ASD62_05100 [Phycicoccus sp. Root563]|nr:hypothetical protein ASD62_05100 [Phycicoccus sp. Root563]